MTLLYKHDFHPPKSQINKKKNGYYDTLLTKRFPLNSYHDTNQTLSHKLKLSKSHLLCSNDCKMAVNRTKLVNYALVAVPPPPARYTLSEWHLNNRFRNRICLDQQKLADSVIAESDRLIDVVNEKADLNKKDVDHKLNQKIQDIEFNSDEINKQRKEVCTEIENLNTYMDRLQDALQALKENAKEVCQKCLILREGRLGIDLCCDAIEIELKKEHQTIEGAQSLLIRTLEQSNEQVTI